MGPDAGGSFSQQFVAYQRYSKYIVAETTLQSRQQVVYMQPDPKFERSDVIDWGSSSSRYVYYPPAFRYKFVPDYYRKWELANQEIEHYVVLNLPLPRDLQELKDDRSKYGQRCLRKGLRTLDGDTLQQAYIGGEIESKRCGRTALEKVGTVCPYVSHELFNRVIEAPVVYREESRRYSSEEIEAVQQPSLEYPSRISELQEASDYVFEHYDYKATFSYNAIRVEQIEPTKYSTTKTPAKTYNRTVKVAHSGELCDDEFEGYYNVRGRSHGCCF